MLGNTTFLIFAVFSCVITHHFKLLSFFTFININANCYCRAVMKYVSYNTASYARITHD